MSKLTEDVQEGAKTDKWESWQVLNWQVSNWQLSNWQVSKLYKVKTDWLWLSKLAIAPVRVQTDRCQTTDKY